MMTKDFLRKFRLSGWTVTGMIAVMMWASSQRSHGQERTVFIAEGRIGNAATQPGQWAAGDFEYDLSTNTAAPAVKAHYPWGNGVPVEFEVRYDAVSGRAQLRVGSGENLEWEVPGVPLTSNGVVNLRWGGRGGNVAGEEYGLVLWDLRWETNGVLAVALTNRLEMAGGAGYVTGLISGLPAAKDWRLSGWVWMGWPDGTPPARSQLAFQLAFTEPLRVTQVEWFGVAGGARVAETEEGVRAFCESPTADDSQSSTRHHVGVRAYAPGVADGTPVYFRVLDVDDPSYDTAPVDENGSAGNDNRPDGSGVSPQGQFVGATSPVDYGAVPLAGGWAEVVVELARQPGNNYRVAASLSLGDLLELTVDEAVAAAAVASGSARPGAGKKVPPGKEPMPLAHGAVGPECTVWRTVRVELDAMEAPGEKNRVKGWLRGIVEDKQKNLVSCLVLDTDLEGGLTPVDPSPNLDSKVPGAGRFSGFRAWIQVGGVMIQGLTGNGKTYVRKDSGFKIPCVLEPGFGQPATGWVVEWKGNKHLRLQIDPNSPRLPDNTFRGAKLKVGGVAVALVQTANTNPKTRHCDVTTSQVPVIPYVLHDDDDDMLVGENKLPDVSLLAEKLKVACVKVEYVAKDLNRTATVPFVANIMEEEERDLAKGKLSYEDVARWDTQAQNTRHYWVTYVLAAFQPDVLLDYDPDDDREYDQGDDGQPAGILLGRNTVEGSFIFREQLREVEITDKEADTVVHEVAHALADENIRKWELEVHPVTDGKGNLVPAYVRAIRESPGPRPLPVVAP